MKVLKLLAALMAAAVFAGCDQPAGSNKGGGNESQDGASVISSGVIEDVGTWEIRRTVSTEERITTNAIAYTLTDTTGTKKTGFAVAKMMSGDNAMYKGAIMAARSDQPFEDEYWTQYSISLGQSNVLLSDALSYAETEPSADTGLYSFMIMGGFSEYDVEKLKNATAINIELQNELDSSRYTVISVMPQFQQALFTYF